MNTSRVLVAMGALTLMTYGTALAQAPAQPPSAPPSSVSPAAPPSSSAGAQADTQLQTATGELVSIAQSDKPAIKTGTLVVIQFGETNRVIPQNSSAGYL